MQVLRTLPFLPQPSLLHSTSYLPGTPYPLLTSFPNPTAISCTIPDTTTTLAMPTILPIPCIPELNGESVSRKTDGGHWLGLGLY